VITETVYTILTASSPIVSIRVFPSVVPQGQTFPAITYSRDSTRFLQTFDGHNSLVESSFQIDCYAYTVAEAETLAASVKSTMLGYATSPVNQIRIDNWLSLFEPETELHRVLLQFTIWHVEAA